MRVALFKGKSLVSYAIRFFTRSEYSHAAFYFDDAAEAAAKKLIDQGRNLAPLVWFIKGSVVEAWQGGVKNSPSLNTLHTPGTRVDLFDYCTPLTQLEEMKLVAELQTQVGLPYDYADILNFLIRRKGDPGKALFCSELVDKDSEIIDHPLFRHTEPWRVPPDWLSRSLALKLTASVVTA